MNKEPKQKLNFPCCEEETEAEGQKEAQESRKAQRQTPEKSEVQDSEAKFTPPRTSLSYVQELDTFQEKGQVSPDQILRTPVSDARQCPEAPAQTENRSKLIRCESPFTPRVSKLGGGERPECVKICVSSVQLIKRCSHLCVSDRVAPKAVCILSYMLTKKSLKSPECRINCLASCLSESLVQAKNKPWVGKSS